MHFSLSPYGFVTWLQHFPPETITLFMLVSCGIAMLIMMRLFGAAGLMVYSAIAAIIANLQVQTVTKYSFFHEPVALGTDVFASIFIATGILTEYYGAAQARKAVWLGFTSLILMMLFMLLTIGFKPVCGFYSVHKAMCTLFLPAPALVTAGLIAYVAGQLNDIWIFTMLSRLTRGKYLWFRSFVATLIGAFLDNLIFSVLAWIVFSPRPLSWKTVFLTYVLGTYLLRVFVALVGIPFIYLARLMVRK